MRYRSDEVQLRLMRHCEGRVSKRESKRDRERERARRQPFKIQFPGSEEANPASVIPCSRSKPPSILPSLPPSPSSSLLSSLTDSTLSLYSSVSNILSRCLSHCLTISPLNLSPSLSLFPPSLTFSLFLSLSEWQYNAQTLTCLSNSSRWSTWINAHMPRSMAAIKSGGDGTCSPSLFLSPFPSLHAHRAARPIVSPFSTSASGPAPSEGRPCRTGCFQSLGAACCYCLLTFVL